MKTQTMSVLEMACYTGIDERQLIRAICNRGTLAGVPLPESLDHTPLSSRRWLRSEVRLFKHALTRARA
ncbi:hypothetical protein [[Erwinia] mediterraneensis]|uniref:hypothetical protein n=1 Tax=[Erwinia] mediterraneensis TaxID=2161819 RepID=UPI00102FF31F|nr:hypothetical protein [[Erwinia] mediterraneensis]